MITGNRGSYHWIVWESQFLGELISAVPQILLDKIVAITAFDGGPFVPSADLIEQGWSAKSGVAYSPRIIRVENLPRGQYDEWYIYPSRREIGAPEVFINYAGFQFRYYVSDIELHGILERFWLQMECLQPESYIAEGEVLLLATRDATLYEAALEWKFPRMEKNDFRKPGGEHRLEIRKFRSSRRADKYIRRTRCFPQATLFRTAEFFLHPSRVVECKGVWMDSPQISPSRTGSGMITRLPVKIRPGVERNSPIKFTLGGSD